MIELVELQYQGRIIGVFSSGKAADKFMEEKHPNSTYSIYPIGTLLETDIDEQLIP